MSKGTRKVMGALFAAVLALVLVVCILCATFARYTTSSTGDSGAVSVELWDVRAESAQGEETAYVKATSLRPNFDEEYGNNNGRSRTAEPIALMTFENLGSLDADIFFSCKAGGMGDTAEVTLNWDDEFAGWGVGWETDDGTNAYMQKIMGWVDSFIDGEFNYTKSGDDDGRGRFNELVNCGYSGDGLFSVKFGTMDSNEEVFSDISSEGVYLKSDGSLTVWAEITWTSHYTPGIEHEGRYAFSMEQLSDAIDTIIGMYVESIGFTIEWEAVQASQTGYSTP